jgi:predicted LPLAT superfamily acyltransferase
VSAAPSPGAARPEWLRVPERGSSRLLRQYARFSRAIGRGPSRLGLHLITLYYLLSAPRARAQSRRYLRRVLGREARWRDIQRHFFCFATTIHDRVFLADGTLDSFEVEVEGEALLDQAIAAGRGAVLMGAHLGSFEMIGAVGSLRAGVRVAMAMYEDNARKVQAMMEALQPRLRPQIVALGRMDAMLQVRDLLDDGFFVGLLADRTIGEEPSYRARVLDGDAWLPMGPMRAAAMLKRRVIFMTALYLGGRRYRLVFAPVADFTGLQLADRDARIAAAIQAYAALLGAHCRAAPFNWFNFYDFWRT